MPVAVSPLEPEVVGTQAKPGVRRAPGLTRYRAVRGEDVASPTGIAVLHVDGRDKTGNDGTHTGSK
jgi:hypothetical protein